jgi:hypothetical protein
MAERKMRMRGRGGDGRGEEEQEEASLEACYRPTALPLPIRTIVLEPVATVDLLWCTACEMLPELVESIVCVCGQHEGQPLSHRVWLQPNQPNLVALLQSCSESLAICSLLSHSDSIHSNQWLLLLVYVLYQWVGRWWVVSNVACSTATDRHTTASTRPRR